MSPTPACERIGTSLYHQDQDNLIASAQKEDEDRVDKIISTVVSVQEAPILSLDELPRKVTFNLLRNPLEAPQTEKDQPFVTNKIRTARYNFFSFLPISLMIQYTKLGNVFWTIQAILQASSPAIRTQNPYLVSLLVISILTLGIFKEWLSDHKRSVADKLVNEKVYCRVVRVAPLRENDRQAR